MARKGRAALNKLRIALATDAEREAIYQLRHAVYATELGQHAPNDTERLSDALDAWFAPSPRAIAALREHLPWLMRTSPPQESGGLVRAIAGARGVPPDSIAVGAGSSSLIYWALRHWLSTNSRVLLPDPTYGEYAHVFERVSGRPPL